MPAIQSFRQLHVWRRSMDLAVVVYRVSDLLPATDAVRAKCIAVADDLHAVGEWLRKARASPVASASS